MLLVIYLPIDLAMKWLPAASLITADNSNCSYSIHIPVCIYHLRQDNQSQFDFCHFQYSIGMSLEENDLFEVQIWYLAKSVVRSYLFEVSNMFR